MTTCAEHPESEPVNAFTGMANPAGLASCMALSEAACVQLNLSDEDTYAVRLSVEEACINVIDHGYEGREPGPMKLAFRLSQCGGKRHVIIQLRDAATPFHPDNAPAPDLLADLDDRKVGGLGWFFIKSTMDEVTYQSVGDENCLTLVKHLNDAPG